jgi:hypothetical protein
LAKNRPTAALSLEGILYLELLEGLWEVADPDAVVVNLEARRALGPELDEQGLNLVGAGH